MSDKRLMRQSWIMPIAAVLAAVTLTAASYASLYPAPVELRCANSFVAGFRLLQSSGQVTGIQIACARVSGDGNWVPPGVAPFQAQVAGHGAKPLDRVCAANTYVVGHWTTFYTPPPPPTRDLITDLEPVCGNPLIAPRVQSPPQQLAPGYRRYIRECGPGEAVVGLLWDRSVIWLRCAQLSASDPILTTPETGFLGVWDVTVNDGYRFEVTLTEQGGGIVGTYDVGRRDGAISNGVVTGDTLTFDWVQTGTIKGSGKGSFRLLNPNEMWGTWTFGPFGGTWEAKRK